MRASEKFGVVCEESEAGQLQLYRAYAASRCKVSGVEFGALVLDYDGTLCNPGQRTQPPSTEVIHQICRLATDGVQIGIATGRGESVVEQLRTSIPQSLWSRIHIGLLNAQLIASLAEADGVFASRDRAQDPKFNAACVALNELKELGLPITRVTVRGPYQVSVRLQESASPIAMWAIVADVARRHRISPTRVVHGRHSVDILSHRGGKGNIFPYLSRICGDVPILSIADQGAWPGNDYQLLDQAFSVAVDIPSRNLSTGWQFAPQNLSCAEATAWYLALCRVTRAGFFFLNIGDDQFSPSRQ
ncbi:HAD hydrolase family protein [Burkholderia sp. BCC1988]|uniref:HAD hydrolase family protein n=1 Tax=Burkholderia sp. BCC1988 TaxID=2817443 RepID=UPI002AB133CE|nr:HAD hydrolase family protein [Burkholderia sp. BCC1988]